MEHRGYMNNNKNKATWDHLNLPGHSVNDVRFAVWEQVKYDSTEYRKEREKDIIKLVMNTIMELTENISKTVNYF